MTHWLILFGGSLGLVVLGVFLTMVFIYIRLGIKLRRRSWRIR